MIILHGVCLLQFKNIIIISLFTYFLFYSYHSFANTKEIIPYKKHVIAFLSENDGHSFMKTDRYYTNGARIGYVSKEYDYFKENNPMSWAKYVTIANYGKPHITRFNISINQEMYTPAKHGAEPTAYDHPYGGFLYLNLGLYNRTYNTQEHIGLKIGVTGPYSFAGYVQTALHNGTGQMIFNGWHNQIDTEIIFNPYYQWTGRVYIFKTKAISMDFLGTFDAAIGNVDVHFGGYGQFRIGHNLDVDFGASKMNSQYDASPVHSDSLSVYLFFGGGPRIVFHNLLVEGNSFDSKMGYDVNILRFEATAGIMMSYMGYRIGYAWTFNTRDYKQQRYDHVVGAIMLEFSF